MKETCETCKYFRKHYVKMGKRYSQAGNGHYVEPRLKMRRNSTPACAHYQK